MKIKLLNAVELYYKKIGKGQPLLLLHGNGDTHEGLEKLGTALSSHFTVYLIDSRGHGKSSHKNEYISYTDFAEDVDYFIKELNLSDVSIIGHSDGAIIATLLAISKKAYLNKIILLGVTLRPEQMKEVWKIAIRRAYDSTHDSLVELMLREPQIELNELEDIEIPTLVVAAEDDVMETERYAEIAQAIPEGKFHCVKNEDHMSYVINTDQFAQDALDFLNKD